MKPDEALNHEWIKEGMIQIKNRQMRNKAAAVSSERKRGMNPFCYSLRKLLLLFQCWKLSHSIYLTQTLLHAASVFFCNDYVLSCNPSFPFNF